MVATTSGAAEMVVGAVATEVDAGVDEATTLVSATLGVGCGTTAADAIASDVELVVENCAIGVEDGIVTPASGATVTGAAVVDCTWDGSSTCVSETEVDVTTGEDEKDEE